jgi:hypothetical protein
MARKQKLDDRVQEIINRILTSPIPDEGHLSNPLTAQKRTRSGQVKLGDVNSEKQSKTIDQWGTKEFVDYFATKFQDVTGGNYRRAYRADGMAFQEMISFFASNGVPRNEWTKKFIDWAFSKRDQIKRKYTYFTPHTILNVINYFYQDEILPLVEVETIEREETDAILANIESEIKSGKNIEVFIKYGIPITATYMIKKCDADPKALAAILHQRLDILMQTDRKQAKQVFLKSIINSPYPTQFEFLDWRDLYSDFVSRFENESWWRPNDYRGAPLKTYKDLL